MSATTVRDPYFDHARAQAIFFYVLLFHVGIIGVPLLIFSLLDRTEHSDPPLVVMKVGLEMPFGDSPDAGLPVEAAPVNDPAPAQPVAEPISAPKVEPKKDPPKVEPKKDTPKVEPKKDTPKVEPKKDTPKVESKKDPPKVEPAKTDPPKPKYLTADQIKVTTNPAKTQAQIDADNKAKAASEKAAAEAKARADAAAKARADALKDLQNAAHGTKPGTYGTQTPGQEGIQANAAMRKYQLELEEFIKPRWDMASPSETEFDKRKVTKWPLVHLTVDKDGRVTNAVIREKSGVAAVDAAVQRFLAELKAVPAPPAAATFPVTLKIEK